jgi:hypothetical protein
MTGTIPLDLIFIICAVTVNLLILAAAWVKFRTVMLVVSKDIKNHTDISVQKLNGMLSYFMHSAERPMWIKRAVIEEGKITFRMLEMNRQYSNLFGIQRIDYIGKTDLEAGWPKEAADAFYAHDLKVWATGHAETYSELVHGEPTRFRKMLLETPDGTKKGVMGYAIDAGDWKNPKVEGTLKLRP